MSATNGDAALAEERAFLLRSLADLEREHAAGDLSDEDLEALQARYRSRLEEVELALAGVVVADEEPGVRRRPRLRRAVGVLVVVGLAAGAGLGVASTAGRRETGEEITGEAPSTRAGRLNRAAEMVLEGRPAEALEIYDALLAEDPDSVDALAEKGLLLLQLSQQLGRPVLATEARASIEAALRVEPRNPRALFYLGLALRLAGEDARARSAFERALAADPEPALRERIEAFHRSTEAPTTVPPPAATP